MDPQASHLLPVLIPLLFVALLVRRNLRARKLKVERLWILPAGLIAAAGWILCAEAPPPIWVLAGYAAVAALGAGVGWWRGRLTHLHLHPETHEVSSRASFAGMILILAVFAARYGVRIWALQGQDSRPGHMAGDARYVSDAFVLFAVGLMSAQRLELYLRCRRMLADAGALKDRAD